MKKIYFAVLCFLSLVSTGYANPGDTTLVQANIVDLDYYNNFDTLVSFPDGSVSYRKIIMEFDLGKYACPGYDPNDPGEISDGHTGWCGDWDYDVHIIACVPGGDTMELGRLITPYANSNFPRTPLSWQHPYLFDVTDFYPILKNDVTIRILYSGYSGGFTANVKFHFIEGTPARNVLGIDNLWQGGYAYGNTGDPIESHINPKTLTFPPAAVSAEMKLIITGHGGDSSENCAEFCKKWYQFDINGNMVDQTDIWRDDCGSSFLYPQSGTWIYNRGNWCPGDLVRTNIHHVPSGVAPGQTFTADLTFQNYNAINNAASYKVAAAMFYYGPFNHATDAGLEEIISPNKQEAYYRYNPVCGEPVVKVKNYGSNAITSIKFKYGIEGQTLSTYTWANNLASMESADITLPSFADLNEVSGTNNQFVAIIEAVNGVPDEEDLNDQLISEFEAAPKWEGGNFYVDFKMPGIINHVNWNVTDLDGNVLYHRNGTQSLAEYKDTLHLLNGCYKLNVDASYDGYGISFFGAFTPGKFRILNLANGTLIPLPKNDLGASGLAGNFGNGFTQYFTVVNATSITDVSNNFTLNIYPNPVKDFLNVDIIGNLPGKSTVQLIDILGQVVYQLHTQEKKITIPVQQLAAGIYTLHFESGQVRKQEKVVITR